MKRFRNEEKTWSVDLPEACGVDGYQDASIGQKRKRKAEMVFSR